MAGIEHLSQPVMSQSIYLIETVISQDRISSK